MKYKELIKNILIFALGGFGTKLILFLLVPLYTYYMSPEEYGISDLVFTISQFLVPIVTLTVFEAVTRFGLSREENRQNVLLAAILIWLIGAAALMICSSVIDCFEFIAEWKWYLVLYVILYGATQIELNFLKVIEKNKQYSAISIFQALVLAGLSVLLIGILKTGIEGYLLSNIIALFITMIVTLIVGNIISDLRKAKFDKQLLIRMLMYSAPLILNNVSWWAIHSTDKLMINRMVGAAALGIYTVASKIPSLLNVFIGFFIQAWGLSSIKEIESTNDIGFYTKIFEVYTSLIFIVCVSINMLIKPFMIIYTSAAFNEAWRFVPALLVAATFNAVSSFFGTLYSALKRTVNNMVTTLIAAFINVVANYFFILLVGTWGAVIGTFVSYIFVACIRMFDVRRYLQIKVNWKKYIISIFIVVVHMLCVMFEFNLVLTSIVSLCSLVYLNRKDIAKFGVLLNDKIANRTKV